MSGAPEFSSELPCPPMTTPAHAQAGVGLPILRDKLELWRSAAISGNADLRGYHRRAVAELEAVIDALERIARWERHGGEKPLVYPAEIARQALSPISREG